MENKKAKPDLVFEKCYKVNCSPAIEVFKDRISYFRCENMTIEQFRDSIKHTQLDLERKKKTLEVWEKNFNK